LYAEIRLFACSNPSLPTSRVLRDISIRRGDLWPLLNLRQKSELHAPFDANNRAYPPHLGSEIFAACRTRPQYVLRSYWEAGSSRLPGIEDDISRSLRRREDGETLQIERIWAFFPLSSRRTGGCGGSTNCTER
jgi:hypothetical protein